LGWPVHGERADQGRTANPSCATSTRRAKNGAGMVVASDGTCANEARGVVGPPERAFEHGQRVTDRSVDAPPVNATCPRNGAPVAWRIRAALSFSVWTTSSLQCTNDARKRAPCGMRPQVRAEWVSLTNLCYPICTPTALAHGRHALVSRHSRDAELASPSLAMLGSRHPLFGWEWRRHAQAVLDSQVGTAGSARWPVGPAATPWSIKGRRPCVGCGDWS
jgi:hypothetical protein